ncbi:MAG: hypothetical protein NFCOHLIN_01064 [Gammaproteobacteria bacterium]|nr:hypothetical protein [Gammaproteobacteria bacterium]
MVQQGDGAGRSNENVTRIRCLFQEDDGYGKPLPLEPHVVVESSAGKFHRYLFVEGMSVEEYRPVQARLVSDYGSDPNAKDPARVLRLPGFFHMKDREHPWMVRIASTSGAQPYSLGEILRALPPVTVTERARNNTGQGQPIAPSAVGDLRSALYFIPADDRDLWVKVGMALKTIGEVGRGLWLEWSATSTKFDPADAARVWDSLQSNSIDQRFVFAEATRRGWTKPNGGDKRSGYIPKSLAPAYPDMPELTELRVTAEEAQAAALAPTCIVEEYLHADVSLFVAPGKTGKTTLYLYEAVHITLGRPLYGLQVMNPGAVLIVTAEDARERLIARLRAIMTGLELDEEQQATVRARSLIWDVSGTVCRLAELDEGNNIVLTGLADMIIERCKKEPPMLVIFDPAISFGAGERFINDNEQALVLAARRIVSALGCCVRVVQHTGKSNARERTMDIYTSRGGSALPDGARMVAVVQSHDDKANRQPPPGLEYKSGDQILVLARTSSYTSPNQPIIWLRRSGYTYTYAIEFKEPPSMVRQRCADRVLAFLVEELQQGYRHTKSSLETRKIMPREQLRAALAELEASGRVFPADFPQQCKQGGRKTYLHPHFVPLMVEEHGR